MDKITTRPTNSKDQQWIENLVTQRWGAVSVVAHGEVFFPAKQPGLLAESTGKACGLLTYNIQGQACEVITLDTLESGKGIGSTLVETVKEEARAKGCTRLWLITTNDNLGALAFYQKIGFRLAALHAGAIDLSRKLKPEIPLVGDGGIPIRDEIELEMDI